MWPVPQFDVELVVVDTFPSSFQISAAQWQNDLLKQIP